MAGSRGMQLLSTKHEPLLQELRGRTGATDVCLIKTLDLVYAEHHVLSAAFEVGGTQIRYFYRVAVANSYWTRFNFEGSTQDFFKWFEQKAYTTPELWKARMASAPDMMPSGREEMYIRRRSPNGVGSKAADNSAPPMSGHTRISSAKDVPQSATPYLLHLSRESRDLSYEWLPLDTHAVHLLDHNNSPLFSAFATTCSFMGVDHQLRAEFWDHLCRRKGQMKAITLVAVNGSTNLSRLLAEIRAQDVLCLEFRTQPPWADLKALLEKTESVPDTRRPHVTFVFRTTIDRRRTRRSIQERLMCLRRERKDLHFIFKQELTLPDGSASGFAVYHKDYPCVSTPHCVRSDDMPGYLSLLLDFARPSRGHKVVETLGWNMCCFSTISKKEQKVLEEALPKDNADGCGLWIVKDGGGGGPETISAAPRG